MKILIVFYSRTKTTKKVAQEMANSLQCDIEELIDTKKREGALAYVAAGRDAITKTLAKIQETKYDPSDYDIVIIGTPIWAGTLSCAIRTYLNDQKDKLNNVAVFCTKGGEGKPKIYNEIKNTFGLKPKAELTLLTKEVANNNHKEKLHAFINEL